MAEPFMPQVNFLRYDWSSVEIVLAGQRFYGVKEISYSDTLTPGEVRGTGQIRKGVTIGEYKAEASATLFKQEAQQLISALGSDGTGFMEILFDVVVSLSETNAPVITDTLRNCRITKCEDSGGSGADPIAVKLSLNLEYILHNGFQPITNLPAEGLNRQRAARLKNAETIGGLVIGK